MNCRGKWHQRCSTPLSSGISTDSGLCDERAPAELPRRILRNLQLKALLGRESPATMRCGGDGFVERRYDHNDVPRNRSRIAGRDEPHCGGHSEDTSTAEARLEADSVDRVARATS